VNRRIATITLRLVLAAASFAAVAGIAAACAQQEGERCQTNDDCESGLVCNEATALCTGSGSGSAIDATTPDFLDAELDPDAPPDMMIDADKPKI
jgi:hypothetical protein